VTRRPFLHARGPAPAGRRLRRRGGTSPPEDSVHGGRRRPDRSPLTRQVSASIVVLPLSRISVSPSLPSPWVSCRGHGDDRVAVTGLNGFTGTARCRDALVTGLTFVPSAFDLAAGTTQPVQLATTASTPLGTSTVTLAATAAGVAGTKTASLSLTVNPRPDFVLEVVPNAVSIRHGRDRNGGGLGPGPERFAGAILVTAPSISGVSFAPASFSLTPGGTQPVTSRSPGRRRGATRGRSPGRAPVCPGAGPRPDVGVAGSPTSRSS